MFRLSKWYCDCVTDEGSAFVGYWARIGWGALSLPYSAVLSKPEGEPTRERYSLRRARTPNRHGEGLRWECDRLGFRGTWTPGAPSVSRTLLDTTDGTIEWNCHLPSARARIELDGVGSLSGLGYAEQLEMTAKPWRLPFDQLRWGRFLSADHAVTWIEWRGVETNRWVFHNGSEFKEVAFEPRRIELPGDHGVITLHDAAVLREGRLLSTALKNVPGAALWMPRRMRNAYEAKWLSAGTLGNDAGVSHGWAIHELVRL